jgi:two-component system C4-dicarboxylate transport sensor histidine kinase DctB
MAALALAFALCLAVLVVAAAGRWAERNALADLTQQARGTAELNVALTRNTLEKYRSLPFILSQDVDIRAALPASSDSRLLQLDRKLQTLSRGVAAAAVYVLNPEGVAVAASNWNEAASFVGVDYRFRPYFQGAMATGQAEHFALGTISHEAGLFLTRRIDAEDGTVLGVVVVKVDFQALEAAWRRAHTPLFVSDENGVVLLSGVPGWHFRALRPLPDGLAEQLRASLQFGDASFEVLPIQGTGGLVRAQLPDRAAAAPYIHVESVVDTARGWSVHLLMPTGSAVAKSRASAQALAAAGISLLYACCAFGLHLRRRAWRRSRQQADVRSQLEVQVERRTAELRRVNLRLTHEMDERQRAENRLHETQDELVQANKLAVLGQIAAGVAHEINQPVAAIRTYADNCDLLLARADITATQANLHTIRQLTERIGNITGALRAFARKASRHTPVAPTRLADAIAGAMLLVGPRQRRQGVACAWLPPAGELYVAADRMRLEQILVNLLQNAFDALLQTEAPRVEIGIEEAFGQVRLTIADNGPGIGADAMARLFTPFSTTKAEGLGLGLVISRDIARELGGDLTAANAPAGGAIFLLTLKQSPHE